MTNGKYMIFNLTHTVQSSFHYGRKMCTHFVKRQTLTEMNIRKVMVTLSLLYLQGTTHIPSGIIVIEIQYDECYDRATPLPPSHHLFFYYHTHIFFFSVAVKHFLNG